MGIALESNNFLLLIEYVATFCAGMVGGLAAVRKGYDLIAIIVTAWLTALGGGIIRDVMLGALPPIGISDRWFVCVALASGVAVAIIHPEVDRLKWTMLSLDALALALFSVIGTSKAMLFHTSGQNAVFMGLFTAMGGGFIRDMLLNEVPFALRDKHWYVVPSAIGSVCTVFVCKSAAVGSINLEEEIILDLLIVAVIVALRLLSVKFNFIVPGALERKHSYLPGEFRTVGRLRFHSRSRKIIDDAGNEVGNIADLKPKQS
ncbi:MAG: TRIC cation channel family protein [Bifidobacteriaceae bacterium]|nr:TRIC cation channel family protein [Bifidobacteriaceae bacterium]